MDSFDDIQCEDLITEDELNTLEGELQILEKEIIRQKLLEEQLQKDEKEIKTVLLDYGIEVDDISDAKEKVLIMMKGLEQELKSGISKLKNVFEGNSESKS